MNGKKTTKVWGVSARAIARAVAAIMLATSALTLAPGASAPAEAGNTKTMSGEVHCPGTQKVERIWFLGSESGWHGKNISKSQQGYSVKYSFTAVKGETIQVWLDCTFASEKYSEFKVGRGSTRHICGWGGLQWCTSTKLAGCVLKKILANKLNLVSCVRYA